MIVTATKMALGNEWQIRSPYEARNIIKGTVPAYARRWSKLDRCWYVESGHWPSLKAAFTAVGITVVTPDTGSKAKPTTSSASWVREAFQECSPELRPKLRAALMRVFHPDVGGSPDRAKEINSVADELAKEPAR
ncbi:MAG: hypothetical protein H6525_10825 [Actinobacteria bacterium]|nr:hypothetical protein [Actinomycetota bacterium]